MQSKSEWMSKCSALSINIRLLMKKIQSTIYSLVTYAIDFKIAILGKAFSTECRFL